MTDQILVTGAAGFVGRHLVERLVKEGHEVTAVDIQEHPPESFQEYLGSGLTYLSGSILHEEFVSTEVFPYPNAYDRIFHLAAIVGVDRYVDVDDPLYLVDVNINGTKRLLELARGSDTRFVYTSTSEIYGRNPSVPFAEDDDRVLGPPSDTRWSYSSMKGVCEHMIHMLGEVDRGISTTVVRPFNLYGPDQRPNFVVPKFVEKVIDGEVPTVYHDGTQRRCFTYIDDFIDGIVAASERPHGKNETYNLGNTTETEIRDLARTIMDIAGMADGDPEFVNLETDRGEDHDEPDRRIPDVTRAKENLGWEAKTPLEEGLERTYEAFLEDRE